MGTQYRLVTHTSKMWNVAGTVFLRCWGQILGFFWKMVQVPVQSNMEHLTNASILSEPQFPHLPNMDKCGSSHRCPVGRLGPTHTAPRRAHCALAMVVYFIYLTFEIGSS